MSPTSPPDRTSPKEDNQTPIEPKMPEVAAVPLWRKLVGYFLGGVILLFLGLYLKKVWGDLPEGGIDFKWGPMLLSCLLTAIFFLMQAAGWKVLISGLGPPIGMLASWKYWFYSQVAKYVPGKVMLPIVRTKLCMHHGSSVQAVLLSIVLEIVFMLLTALLVTVAVASSQLAEISKGFTYLYIVLIPAGLIGIHPRIIEPVVNFGLKLVRRQPIAINLRYRTMAGLFILFTVAWLVYGVAAYFFCLSFSDLVEPKHLGLITGMFAFAWVAGFLSIITPGGIGVREAALVVLMASVLPEPIAAIIALTSRLQWTGLEIIMAVLLIPVKRKEPN